MLSNQKENSILKLGPFKTGQMLYFFGARHTNNPDDSQFTQLKSVWAEYLDISNENRVVFVEGTMREISNDYSDAIKLYGETGAIQWLAKESNIQVFRPEPDDVKQRENLCSLFDANIVAYSLIIQNLGAWFKHERESKFEKALENSVKREVNFTKIYGFKPDVIWFNNLHKKVFGDQTLEDKDFLDSVSDPRKNGTVVNEVIASRSKMRNEFIMEKITEAFVLEKSIFIVYGMGHMAVLEGHLRKLFGSN
ncbi:MAG: hypothetical protein WAV29_06045 [Microgenomates group bacterium]